MTPTERIKKFSSTLTPGERRVAEAILKHPEAVAFGTVAELAARASTSGPTVMRTAAKLGYEGFGELQSAIQSDISGRLRPAAETIRRAPSGDPISLALSTEVANVTETLSSVNAKDFANACRRLSDGRRRVGVLSGEATAGVAQMLADTLGMLRGGVHTLDGPPVTVARRLAAFDSGDTVVVIDLRRYERWVLDAAKLASDRGLHLIAITDSHLSPLAGESDITFAVTAQKTGPFDSHVGTLALINALVSGAASRLRRTAAPRLDAVESAWTALEALVDPN